jgi:hypothetical protein
VSRRRAAFPVPPPRPTGRRRRRARRVPAFGSELAKQEGAKGDAHNEGEDDEHECDERVHGSTLCHDSPPVASGRRIHGGFDQPAAQRGSPPEPLDGPQSLETDRRRRVTAQNEQGGRDRIPRTRKRYPHDGVPVIDLADPAVWSSSMPVAPMPVTPMPGPSGPRPEPRPRPRPEPPDPARAEWDRQRAEVHALVAAHASLMAEYHRELAKQARARLDAGAPWAHGPSTT